MTALIRCQGIDGRGCICDKPSLIAPSRRYCNECRRCAKQDRPREPGEMKAVRGEARQDG